MIKTATKEDLSRVASQIMGPELDAIRANDVVLAKSVAEVLTAIAGVRSRQDAQEALNREFYGAIKRTLEGLSIRLDAYEVDRVSAIGRIASLEQARAK